MEKKKSFKRIYRRCQVCPGDSLAENHWVMLAAGHGSIRRVVCGASMLWSPESLNHKPVGFILTLMTRPSQVCSVLPEGTGQENGGASQRSQPVRSHFVFLKSPTYHHSQKATLRICILPGPLLTRSCRNTLVGVWPSTGQNVKSGIIRKLLKASANPGNHSVSFSSKPGAPGFSSVTFIDPQLDL